MFRRLIAWLRFRHEDRITLSAERRAMLLRHEP